MHPGTVVQHVRLVRVIGEGGMGTVWLADHLTLNTQVAVKFMAEAFDDDPAARARFSAEAASAARVRSPHVVQVFDHGVAEGRPFIIMELLEGESVEDRLARASPLPLEEVTTLVLHACKGLQKASQLGIVHRDIKPENLFSTREDDGTPCIKVLDFGVARPFLGATHETQAGALVGTPLYMSPEQIRSPGSIDHRSDLWSLGVVAYRALTSFHPFAGEALGAIFLAIDRATPVRPSTLRGGVSPELDRWFSRALARDPAARFQSAREMADAWTLAVFGGSLHSGGSLAATTTTASRPFEAANQPASRPPVSSSRFFRPVAGVVGALALVAVVGLALPRAASRATAVGIVMLSPPPGSAASSPPEIAAGAPWTEGATRVAGDALTPDSSRVSPTTVLPSPSPSSATERPSVSSPGPALFAPPARSDAAPAPPPIVSKRKKKDRGF